MAIGVLIVLQMGFTYLPLFQTLFGTIGIGWLDWLLIVWVSSSVLFLVELEKMLFRRNGRRNAKLRDVPK
jgi:hypothetical protein